MGWFTPSCPVTTHEKAWTEYRLGWLADALGFDRLASAPVVLPTPEFFPDPYTGTEADADRVMHRLCGYMQVNPRTVALKVLHDEDMPGAAGQYLRHARREQAVIRLAASLLPTPDAVVATLAHELAHEILLGGNLLTADTPDHEWITDLLPVFLGVGIFATNTTVFETQGRDGQMFWLSFQKRGYLPLRVFGYALACFAHARGETDPAWATYLRLDAAKTLAAGLRYVRKTGDTDFAPGRFKGGSPRPPARDRLTTGSASARLIAIRELSDAGDRDPALIPQLRGLLGHGDPDVVAGASRALAERGGAATVAYDDLTAGLHSPQASVRAEAALAMAATTPAPADTANDLARWLTDHSPDVVQAVATAITRLGCRLPDEAERYILRALELAPRVYDFPRIHALVAALRTASADPRAAIDAYFVDPENEYGQLLAEVMDESDEAAPSDPPTE